MGVARELAELGSAYNSGGVNQFRNRIINGAMVIDQRNAGASVSATATAAYTYTLDRFFYVVSQASRITIQQNAGAVTPPAGFRNYLGVTSSSAYSVTSGDYFVIGQNIEGFNYADWGWGTANARPVTISFLVRSSLTGTFSGVFRNGNDDRSYAFTYTISAANTWEQKSVTVAGDTGGTWAGATNGVGLRIFFGLGLGSAQTTAAGAWTAGSFGGANGTVSLVGTNAATWYMTGLQVEVGSTATSFDYRPYGTELQLCQRYYEAQSIEPNGAIFTYISAPQKFLSQRFQYAVSKRATPTVTATFSNSKFVIAGTLAVDGTGVHTLSSASPNVSGTGIEANSIATVSASSAATYSYEGSFSIFSTAEL